MRQLIPLLRTVNLRILLQDVLRRTLLVTRLANAVSTARTNERIAGNGIRS